MELLDTKGGHLHNLLATLMHRGRLLSGQAVKLATRTRAAAPVDSVSRLRTLSKQLLSGRGEASGTAIAAEIIQLYGMLDVNAKAAFCRTLADEFGPDWDAARAAWARHDELPSREHFRSLAAAIEPPRQELFRRINRAPGGTAALVRMRADFLESTDSGRLIVDDDLSHLLQSWFNRGFLVMQRIDWSTSADLLERIIRYEAVHQIGNWEELRRRLLPADRRCYAFFHPAMANDPLIFVEVALTNAIPDSIQSLLAKDRIPVAPAMATTAVFYSISNCQPGLLGISFGNFLIKQVVEDLSRELPSLSKFVTLSPVPGFRNWLEKSTRLGDVDPALVRALDTPDWPSDPVLADALKQVLLPLAAEYFLDVRDAKGRPADPVSRFHLGNGARLERICWLGDTSAKGLKESNGLMVNYLYDLASVEANHEAFANEGHVIVSEAIKRIGRSSPHQKGAAKRHVG